MFRPGSACLVALALVALLLSACATTRASDTERRAAVQQMRSDTLAELYRRNPAARAQINAAPGYAVFSNANVNLILASFGGGYGVVRDNASGRDTYMRMGEVGLGLGAGVKDFRAVFVFNDRDSLRRFVESGWTFGGQADAAAKAGDMGAAVAAEAVIDNITVYQMTESGLALQATLKGTRFWRDPRLN